MEQIMDQLASSTSVIALAHAAVTIVVVKNKGGVNASHTAMAVATVLRESGAATFSTVLVDLDGATKTTITKMGERDPDGSLREEQSCTDGVILMDVSQPDQRAAIFGLAELRHRFPRQRPAGDARVRGSRRPDRAQLGVFSADRRRVMAGRSDHQVARLLDRNRASESPSASVARPPDDRVR